MQGNVGLPLLTLYTGTQQFEYLSQEDAKVHWKSEESCGKLNIGGHGSEKVRIVVSASYEGRRHSENFMGCTFQPI